MALEEGDHEEDLHLGGRRERVPHVARRARRGDVGEGDGREAARELALGDRRLDVPREDDAVRVDAVADEAGHRDAAVLDLGVAEPADGLGRHVVRDDAERVPEADDRVELLGERRHALAVARLRRRVPAEAGAWVSGGPNGFMPPSSSSAWMRPMFLAIICEQSAADLVLGGSASTMAMISPSIDLSRA